MTTGSLAKGQWPPECAREWAAAQPWRCGCNFLPSSAVNFLEMWHGDTFDPVTIERELGWAAEIGLNAVRTNLPYLVWSHDRDGLIARIDAFLGIAADRGLATMLCPFDDCAFGGAEPVYGPQPEPIPGIHNSRAVASPGRATVMNRAAWPDLERYLCDVIAAFAHDTRVFVWDLYNEPGNGMVFADGGLGDVAAPLEAHSHALMRAAFEWARGVGPSQPLTVGAWRTPAPDDEDAVYASPIDRDALDLSDVLSFHAYLPMQRTGRIIAALEPRARPLMCTEWMARAVASRIADQLDLMRRHDVGCFHWGLVRGRTQTHLPWPEELIRRGGGAHDGSTWFHDLLEPDGSAYDPQEIALIRATSAGTPGEPRSAPTLPDR